jgi:hypothetical protein
VKLTLTFFITIQKVGKDVSKLILAAATTTSVLEQGPKLLQFKIFYFSFDGLVTEKQEVEHCAMLEMMRNVHR